MNNYDFIKSIDKNLYLELVKRGVIPINIMTWVTIYESYNDELKRNKPTLSATFTADKYNISESSIWKIKAFMER